jgi:uncharacterized protein YcbK (DUF882 family)
VPGRQLVAADADLAGTKLLDACANPFGCPLFGGIYAANRDQGECDPRYDPVCDASVAGRERVMATRPIDAICRQRRRLVTGLALAQAVPLLPRAAWAAEPAGERALSLHHTHTGEQLRVVYFAQGVYLGDGLRELEWLLRDFRTGTTHPIDSTLYDTLHALAASCGGGTFEVISGYRSPQTNAMLRRASHGVAERSLHLEGRAIDIRLTGTDTARLRAAAIALGRGGVGYYPQSDFVHVDTGRFRTWGATTA